MSGQTPAETARLALYVFGAITFSILTLFYWRERRRTSRAPAGALPVFSLVAAAAFLGNLVYEFGGGAFFLPVLLTRTLAAGLLPPLMLHLALESSSLRSSLRRGVICVLTVLYAAAVGLGAARVSYEMGLWTADAGAILFRAPAAMLGVSAVLAMALEVAARRWWRATLLCAILVCSVAGGALAEFPDYLLLGYFGATLYARERLAFFDVLVKRGLFVAVGLGAVTIWIASGASGGPWAAAAGMLALWVAGPWLYGLLTRAVDHFWLRRRYSPADAERRFMREIQAAANEGELRQRAEASLGDIFQTKATIEPPGAAGDGEIAADVAGAGVVRLAPRPGGIPFLSDDSRLLQSLAGALGVVLENVRFRQREQELRLMAGRAELKALRAQINPHFLFNTLSVIAGLLHYRPGLAEETIEQLAHVFRYTLRKSDCEWTPLGEEVEFVTAYLRIEQTRFGERLVVEIDVDPAAASIPIPTMSIQPLIENAIRHGISASTGPGRVSLRVGLRNGAVTVEVADNGPGFPDGFLLEEQGEGHGLRNVRDRIQGYFGGAARLSCESNEGGAKVTLTLPHGADVRCA